MGILDIIAEETNGTRQYSDQYQIRSNGSHTVHKAQERPFLLEQCLPLSVPDNFMLDELFAYAEKCVTGNTALSEFCRLAYNRFSPKEIFGYLYWHRELQEDAEQLAIIRILNDLMLEDDEE